MMKNRIGTSDTALTISVIIPIFNEARNIPTLISSLDQLSLGEQDEILFVDDGSVDCSADLLREYVRQRGPQIRLVQLHANQGRSEAINAGAREASGELCAFTDADAQPPRDWLACIRSWFSDPQTVAGGGAFAPTNASEGFVRFYYLGDRVMNEVLAKHFTPNKLSGVNSAVRRQVLLQVGGLRREAWWSEDSDLCFRLRPHGRIHYDPATVVLTRYPATLSEIISRKWIWGQAMGITFRQAGIPDPRLLIRPAVLSGLSAALLALPFLRTAQRQTLLRTLLALYVIGTSAIWGASRNRLKLPEAVLAVPLLFLRETAYVAGLFHGLWRGDAAANRSSWKAWSGSPPTA